MASCSSSPTHSSKTTSNFVENSNKIFKIVNDCVSTLDLQEVPTDLAELQVICDKFAFKSELFTQLRGKNLTINANNVEVQQSCTVNLSGNLSNSFTSDASRGRDGKDGCAGESGGNFALICETFSAKNDAILTIISNGADGMNGQNGGDGENGTNGKDATQKSFIIDKCDWKLYNPISAESQEMYKKFGLVHWDKNTSQSVIKTEDELTAYIYVQTSPHEDCGLMLIKGDEAGQQGGRGGRGGFGGQGGYPGKIFIKCDDIDYSKYIRIIENPGRDGKNGTGGFNGVNGRCGRDLWKYDLRSWDQPKVFGEDKPKKFELAWGGEDYIVFDSIKKNYVCVQEVCDIIEPITGRFRVDSMPNRKKSQNSVAHPKNAIDLEVIRKEHEQFMENKSDGFIRRSILRPMFNIFAKIDMRPIRFSDLSYLTDLLLTIMLDDLLFVLHYY